MINPKPHYFKSLLKFKIAKPVPIEQVEPAKEI